MNAPRPPSLAAPSLDDLAWEHGFGHLPPAFYTRLQPAPLPDPYLVAGSDDAARAIGLDPSAFREKDTVAALAGSRVPRGADTLAAVYAGHQFGVYVPQLGDGRALLLGDVPALDGGRWELQLKGSGRTPYSRMGDGRAVLRSSIREFLASEAMAGLGVPTTRALSVVGADQPVIRETVETAAVVVRMSPSFVRFGNFEFFFWRQQAEPLRQLADYVIDAFYPACRAAPQPYLALLEQVVARTAELIAHWQAVGFCHGVMNTDNMSILGLTIDYGPFQFMDGFDAAHICNHSDDAGRYAYNQQPAVAHWNLYCLGQALIPLIEDVEATQAVLERFKPAVTAAMEQRFRDKLGLATTQDGDDALLQSLLERLQAERTDWTIVLAPARADPRRRPVGRGGAAARPVRRPCRVRCLGRRLPCAPAARSQPRRRACAPHARGQPALRAAQSPRRDGDPQGPRRRRSTRLRRSAAPAADTGAPVRRAA